MSTIYVWIIAMFVISIIIAVVRPMIKGKVGEAAVSLLLKQLASDKYKIVNDVILSSEGGNTSTTQIDHIVVSVYGIFSIETKNYKGWICGTENAKQWTQSIYGHKYKFMNPIHQNYAHVKALESMLRRNGYEAVPIYSIIAFPGDTTLKVTANKARVVKWGAVADAVKNLSDTVCLSNDDVEKITTKLMDREAEKMQLREHINEIHEVKVDKQQKLTSGICPKCGSELILRNGKYGKFYGCSGYPKCRFTAPVD